MNDSRPITTYRPLPGTRPAKVLAELERLAVVRAELPGALVRALAVEPALPLTDLSALRGIVCTDAAVVPEDVEAALGVPVADEEPVLGQGGDPSLDKTAVLGGDGGQHRVKGRPGGRDAQ